MKAVVFRVKLRNVGCWKKNERLSSFLDYILSFSFHTKILDEGNDGTLLNFDKVHMWWSKKKNINAFTQKVLNLCTYLTRIGN